AIWPFVTNSAWHLYTITWDGTNIVDYLDGSPYTSSSTYSNSNNRIYTNRYESGRLYTVVWTNDPVIVTQSQYGILSSTNSVGGLYNWIAVGVNSHSNLPTPDNMGPNNGQLWGQLADIRIYRRALSAAEVLALYSGGSVATRPSAPPGLRILNARSP